MRLPSDRVLAEVSSAIEGLGGTLLEFIADEARGAKTTRIRKRLSMNRLQYP